MITSRVTAKLPEYKTISIAKLSTKLQDSANLVVNFLESKLQKDGSYGSEAKDIACYFKSPMMFLAANKPHVAARVLNYIKTVFMSPDGDFKTTDTVKSKNQAYIEYWTYTNGWIIRAANQLGLKDISQPGYKYITNYNLGEKVGFLTRNIEEKPVVTDILTAAHHGLVNLEMGNLDIAISAGMFLCNTIKKQNNLRHGFYLRLDKQGNLITDFSKEQAPFYFVSTTETNQLHFMIGYPSAYLAILYKKTKKPDFLIAAKAYLDFSLSCDKDVYKCDFSHKISWAASLIYECTGDDSYLLVIDKISNYFFGKQKNNMWFIEDINISYDQSAEIACWFLDIIRNINNFKKKITLKEGEKQQLIPRPLHRTWTIQAFKYGTIALVTGMGLYVLLQHKGKSITSCNMAADTPRRLNGI